MIQGSLVIGQRSHQSVGNFAIDVAYRLHHIQAPEGVAAVQRGDLLEGVVAGVGTVRTKIV